MIIKRFVASNKRRAVRKAIDFWYKEHKDDITLLDFLAMCGWKKTDLGVVVTFRSKEIK
jgi:hypothetical protein